MISVDFSKEIGDLFLRQHVELSLWVALPDDAYLDVLWRHLALEDIFQCLNGRVHSVADVHIIREDLLEEGSRLGGSLAEGSSLPAVEGARSFDLEELWALLLIEASDDQADSEGTTSARHSVVLEKVCHILAEHEG